MVALVQCTSRHNGAQRGQHCVSLAGGVRIPFTPWDGHKLLHRDGHGGKGWSALRTRGAPTVCIAGCLFRVAGIQRIPRLFFQPPLEVLPSPTNPVVQSAFGDFDVFVGFLHRHDHMAVAAAVVADQVAGADLLPARVVHPSPGEVAKRGVGTQCGPTGAVDPPLIGPVAGGMVGRRPWGVVGVLLP